jgi:hypothetical protein
MMKMNLTNEEVQAMFEYAEPSITIALNPQPEGKPQTVALVERIATEHQFFYDRQITDYVNEYPRYFAESDIYAFDLPKIAERLQTLSVPESQIELFLQRGIDPIDLFRAKYGYDLGRSQRNYLEYFELEDPEPLDMMETVLNTRLLTLYLLQHP